MTAPNRLIITLPLGPDRLMFDMRPGDDGALSVTMTRWRGAAQIGQAIAFPVSASSRLARLPSAVEMAIAAHQARTWPVPARGIIGDAKLATLENPPLRPAARRHREPTLAGALDGIDIGQRRDCHGSPP